MTHFLNETLDNDDRECSQEKPICAILNNDKDKLCVSKSSHNDFSSIKSKNISFNFGDNKFSAASIVRKAPKNREIR